LKVQWVKSSDFSSENEVFKPVFLAGIFWVLTVQKVPTFVSAVAERVVCAVLGPMVGHNLLK